MIFAQDRTTGFEARRRCPDPDARALARAGTPAAGRGQPRARPRGGVPATRSLAGDQACRAVAGRWRGAADRRQPAVTGDRQVVAVRNPPPVSARPATLAEALWAQSPSSRRSRRSGDVTSDGKVVTVAFAADAQASGEYAGSATVRSGPRGRLRHGPPRRRRDSRSRSKPHPTGRRIETRTHGRGRERPGRRAGPRSIIGGEIVAVRPDGGG